MEKAYWTFSAELCYLKLSKLIDTLIPLKPCMPLHPVPLDVELGIKLIKLTMLI